MRSVKKRVEVLPFRRLWWQAGKVSPACTDLVCKKLENQVWSVSLDLRAEIWYTLIKDAK